MCTERARQRGLTLIEMLMFIVIVAIALVAILQVMKITTSGSADPVRRKQALMLAESLLEEVQLARFTYCDPSSENADRANSRAECIVGEAFGQKGGEPVGPRPYDNINDYVADPGAPTAAFNNGAGFLVNANGTVLDLRGYSASLTIVPESLGGIPVAGDPADADVLRITVAVRYDGDQTLVLDGYRTRYAPRFE